MVDSWISRRRDLAKLYYKELKKTNLKLPFENKNCKHVYHLYGVYHPNRDLIIKMNSKENIRYICISIDKLHE